MKGLKTKLTQKLGPLPIWAWALVAIGLYFGWRYYQARAGNSDAVNPAANPEDSNYYDGIYGGGMGGSAGGDYGGSGGGTLPPVPVPDPPPEVPPDATQDPPPYVPADDPQAAPATAQASSTTQERINAVRRATKHHPHHAKVNKGGRKHKVSPGVHAHKPELKGKPNKPVIFHVRPKKVSPAVSGGHGHHPHEPQAPPHHHKKKRRRH